MKILTLIVKQKQFDEVIKGTKRVETRQIRAMLAHKYICHKDKDGNIYEKDTDIPEGVDTNTVPVEYDALKLFAGFNKDNNILIEVKSAKIIILANDMNDVLEYEHKGSAYLIADIKYQLGNIIEKNIKTV